ncbi:MAG: hypothetical protein IT236_08190 [Bacteroidia bacterium]|nr:hypothetical protein [Bacteroidia bacterium]
MKPNFIPPLFLFICFAITAFKTDEPKNHSTIKTKFDYFNVDNLGNIYTINGEELTKYLPSTKYFARYSNLKLGNITSVDVTNPLKLVLYYRDFQQIVFLDNQLSLNSEVVSLEQLGYEQTDLVCASANNSFWIYNKQNNELVRFNESSKKIAFTGNLKQVLQTELSPNFMTEYNGFLYLNCPETGIYVFDIFGAFSKVISIKALKQFQVDENLLYFKKDSSLCSFNYQLFEEACKTLNRAAKSTDVKLRNKKIYVSYKDSIRISNLVNL